MKPIVAQMLQNKAKTMPILSFPSAQLIGCTVAELVTDSEKQVAGMRAIAEKCPISASLHMMDLSVEAEAFGAEILFEENEIPTVVRPLLTDIDEAARLEVPAIGTKRTGTFIEGVRRAKQELGSLPVFCGVIGPYSLAGRLMDMTELMMACYDDEEQVHLLLEKCTRFITDYIAAFRAAGADGVVLAEPAAGLLSPSFCEDFSNRYVRRIFETAGSHDFVLVYHNCGNTVPLAEGLRTLGADVYHFGNAVDMEEMLKALPEADAVMGNLNPVDLRTGTPEQVAHDTQALLTRCAKYPNFIASSGCDIPADSQWENITAYFDAVQNFYK